MRGYAWHGIWNADKLFEKHPASLHRGTSCSRFFWFLINQNVQSQFHITCKNIASSVKHILYILDKKNYIILNNMMYQGYIFASIFCTYAYFHFWHFSAALQCDRFLQCKSYALWHFLNNFKLHFDITSGKIYFMLFQSNICFLNNKYSISWYLSNKTYHIIITKFNLLFLTHVLNKWKVCIFHKYIN